MIRAIALLALLAGCSVTEEGLLVGERLAVTRCVDGEDRVFEPFRLDGEFLALDDVGGVLHIRMQEDGRRLIDADALVVTIDEPQVVLDALGQPLALSEAPLRIGLYLDETCPDTRQGLEAVDGTITFFELSTETGERVRAEFAFDVIDRRSGEIVGQGFTGGFTFDIVQDTKHQPFSPDRPVP